MKFFGILYFCFSILFFSTQVIAINQGVVSSGSNLEQCLRHSLKGQNPLDRDRGRMTCAQIHKATLTTTSCAKIAQSLEYSNFEDELKLFCMGGLPAKTTFLECFQVASSINYIDNSENAKWNCIKKFEKKISYKECLQAASKMKFSYNRQRIENFCQEELQQRKR
ncbi:MAG: hypothetical protein AABY64_07355 [Bdellovibrionota bacterium]